MRFSTKLFFIILAITLATSNLFINNYVYADGPIEISTWEQLYNIRNDFQADYVLMNDLTESTDGYSTYAGNAANAGAGWLPIDNDGEPLTGTFDGNNHTISGLYINRPETDYIGLFGAIDGASISNVILTNINITGNNYTGALAGTDYGHSSSLSNIQIAGTISGNNYVGGLIGTTADTITLSNINSDSDVNGNDYIGGLIGMTSLGSISTSSSSGTVQSGGNYVGGLIGNNNLNIENCYTDSDIIGQDNVGGLIGLNSGQIANSYSLGEVTGEEDVGGLIGQNTADVLNSHSEGNIIGIDTVGGLIGINDGGTISTCYSLGTVQGDEEESSIGGLVGQNNNTITNSYAEGDVSGGNDVGGLVGNHISPGSISDSYSIGTVSGLDDIGGLVGINQGSISRSTANGSTTISGNNYVGGLVGINISSITDSYSNNNVFGINFNGGLTGFNFGAISNVYSIGTVQGTENFGGLIGLTDGENGTTLNSFWDTQTSNISTSAQGTGKNTLEMKNILTYNNTETVGLSEAWNIISMGDFTDETWYIDNGNDYPRLAWEEINEQNNEEGEEEGEDISEEEEESDDEEETIIIPERSTSRKNGTSIQARVNNLIGMGKIDFALNLIRQYSSVFGLDKNITTDDCDFMKLLIEENTIKSNRTNDLLKEKLTLCPDKSIAHKETFLFDLELNMISEDVKQLQIFLNKNGYILTNTGPGSLGQETTKFGSLTKQALIRFQQANNIKPAIGYFGPITRALVNNLFTR